MSKYCFVFETTIFVIDLICKGNIKAFECIFTVHVRCMPYRRLTLLLMYDMDISAPLFPGLCSAIAGLTFFSCFSHFQQYNYQDDDSPPHDQGFLRLTNEVTPELVHVSEKNLSEIENVHGYVSHAHISPLKVRMPHYTHTHGLLALT